MMDSEIIINFGIDHIIYQFIFYLDITDIVLARSRNIIHQLFIVLSFHTRIEAHSVCIEVSFYIMVRIITSWSNLMFHQLL